MVQEINEANWDAEVLKSETQVLVDFTATWCGPCKRLSPIVEDLSKDLEGKTKVVKVDIDNSPELAKKYGVRGVPTLMVFDGGEKTASIVGLTSRENIIKLLA